VLTRCRVIDHFGNVGRMIADAFQVLGDEQQMRGLTDIVGFSIMCVSSVRKMES